jgi:hypothetical protein
MSASNEPPSAGCSAFPTPRPEQPPPHPHKINAQNIAAENDLMNLHPVCMDISCFFMIEDIGVSANPKFSRNRLNKKRREKRTSEKMTSGEDDLQRNGQANLQKKR